MERSLFELSPRTLWLARRREIWSEVDSTNLVAERLVYEGAADGTIVLADGQSAGRGRLGRSFYSPSGRSIYLSVLLRPKQPVEELHRHVLVAAVAVAQTARRWLPAHVRVELKWPNDVLLDGRKTSGINLPAQLEGSRLVGAVLGIGVNVNLAADEIPAELAGIATSLRIAGGHSLDRVGFLEDLLVRLETELDELRAGRFAAILERFRESFTMVGARVRIGGPGMAREIEGIIRGVDAEGALLLAVNGVTERIVAGDVTVLGRER